MEKLTAKEWRRKWVAALRSGRVPTNNSRDAARQGRVLLPGSSLRYSRKRDVDNREREPFLLRRKRF